MSSQVDICNAALIKIGQDAPIAALAEGTKAGRAFNRVWDRVLDLVLTAHPWPFALDAQALAPSPDPLFPGWAYRYVVPATCMTALAVCGAAGVRAGVSAYSRGWDTDPAYPVMPGFDGRADYEMVYGTQGTDLVTDQAEAYLIFASRATDVERFPPLFAEALACRLAAEVAPPLAGELGIRLRQTLLQDYAMALSMAITHGFNQSRDQLQPMTPSRAARGGY